MLAIALTGCGPAPAPTSGSVPSGDVAPAFRPVAVSAQRDGVVVTVSASSDLVAAGDPIQLRVDVLNAGLDGVTWESGGCGLLDGFAIEGPDLAQPPAGRDWPDAAGLAKWAATTGDVRLADIGRPDVPDGLLVACAANLDYDEIEAARTVSADALWSGRSTDGVPAPPGSYTLKYAFPLVGRVRMNQIGPEPPAIRPIEVALPVRLEGTAFAGIPSTLAIDAALSDPPVTNWVDAQLPKERLNGAEIRLVDGRWRFTIMVADERSTVVYVGPATGGVDEVQLAE